MSADPQADPRQVPTLPVLVELELSTGRTANVTLFLSMSSSLREGPETLHEFLNSPRRLLPVAEPDEKKRELVARDAIVSVRVMSEIAPRSDGSDAAPAVDLVRIALTNGKIVDGAVRHSQGARLSDYFNDSFDFFAVEDTAGVVYVNKRHVVSINM